jgi:hypothetical protein
VHRVPQRGHLELDGHQPELLDGPGAADITPADEGDRLALPLRERPVHRVLQDGWVAVVVLGGQHDEPVGPVQGAAEARDLLGRVVARRLGRRRGVEERQRVLAQVDQLDVEILAGAKRLADPAGRTLAEPAFTGRA